MKIKWTVSAALAAGSAFVTAAGWTYNNVAWASDVNRIEVRLIKQDLRALRDQLTHADLSEAHRRDIRAAINDAVDALCRIAPADRECK